MKESEWYCIDVCIKCEKRLSNNEVMYRSGVCPKCGHQTNSTMCQTKKVVLKEIRHHKWWQFWKRKYTYIGKDEFSRTWNKNN